jgi:carbohydrate kinase (thermoresistant glucokinase family)
VVLLVVMGVSGVGKTTVGRLVAVQLGLPFHDADDFHPPENRRKMAAGFPLSERDREPWLRELARRIPKWETAGGAVLACSALRARHRKILADAAKEPICVFLDASPETIRARLRRRPGHYMPPSLLESQLATLERPAADEAILVRAEGTPDEVASAIVTALSARA